MRETSKLKEQKANSEKDVLAIYFKWFGNREF